MKVSLKINDISFLVGFKINQDQGRFLIIDEVVEKSLFQYVLFSQDILKKVFGDLSLVPV